MTAGAYLTKLMPTLVGPFRLPGARYPFSRWSLVPRQKTTLRRFGHRGRTWEQTSVDPGLDRAAR
jgi:hypothetical protein